MLCVNSAISQFVTLSMAAVGYGVGLDWRLQPVSGADLFNL